MSCSYRRRYRPARGRGVAPYCVRSVAVELLLVSDLHYSLKQLDWVLAVAADFDVVVLAGEHLDIASAVEPDAQIAVVLEYLVRIAERTTTIACSGNHDLDGENELEERYASWLGVATVRGVHVDGARVEVDDTLI